jgi:prevent-host-death family protein
MPITISQADLEQHTGSIVEQVRHGEPIVVQSHGEDQAVLLGPVDYRLLRLLADYAVHAETTAPDDPWAAPLQAYLTSRISLSKTAELLAMSRFELLERFNHLGIALRLGPENLDEARREIEVARGQRINT